MYRFRAQVSMGLRQNHCILEFPGLSTVVVHKVMAGKQEPEALSTAGYCLPAAEAPAWLSEWKWQSCSTTASNPDYEVPSLP